MAWAILDTNVYIGHWERGLYDEALAQVRQAFIVRHSAVVLSSSAAVRVPRWPRV
ncbi:MAG TPA: hypothetical protein VLK65_26635 [Vicinamibacteria bacterium]|nr:hypothetical protein [Vicinamibacteria bacterium]